ncbi:Uncharacterised protein [Mycobacteroides abscessus subsp. abscessus]|nr:Uncharacterised protein [Mycobacteroides abscessus subsp. abscessus]
MRTHRCASAGATPSSPNSSVILRPWRLSTPSLDSVAVCAASWCSVTLRNSINSRMVSQARVASSWSALTASRTTAIASRSAAETEWVEAGSARTGSARTESVKTAIGDESGMAPRYTNERSNQGLFSLVEGLWITRVQTAKLSVASGIGDHLREAVRPLTRAGLSERGGVRTVHCASYQQKPLTSGNAMQRRNPSVIGSSGFEVAGVHDEQRCARRL